MNAPFRFSLVGAMALGLLYACGDDSGGGGAKTTATSVGLNGGTVQAGSLMLEVPAGALSESVAITVEPTSAISTPAGLTKMGPAFDLGPDGTQFAMPVAVTIDLAAVSIGSKTPVLYQSSDGTSWTVAENSAFDASSQQVTGSISHFSYVASFAAGADAGIAGSSGIGGTNGAGGATTGRGGVTSSAGATNSAGASGAPPAGDGVPSGGTSGCNCCCGQVCVAGMCVAPGG